MKIIGIGDIHGRSTWKQIIEKEKDADKIVFIGDYFDSFDIPSDKQCENFLDIIEYKKNNMDKVVLLIGNHDFHYWPFIEDRCSGYQIKYQYIIGNLIKKNKQYLQMCYKHEKYLFTHAGVSKTWCRNILGNENPNKDILEQIINDVLKFQPEKFNFTRLKNKFSSSYGDDICQTPIWIRPNSLRNDKIEGFTQIVGHTQNNITNYIEDNIWVIDSLPYGEYLIIKNNIEMVGRI